MVRARSAVAVALLLLCLPGAAWGHGELKAEDPEEGAGLTELPAAITVTVTESPAQGSVLEAKDGCKRRVPGEVSIDGNDLVLSVSGGEPGTWTVSYRAISAEDGHLTKGGYPFTVAGKKDCSKQETPGDQIAGGEDTRVNAPDEDEGSSFPIIPFAIGTVVVIAVALLLRRATSSE